MDNFHRQETIISDEVSLSSGLYDEPLLLSGLVRNVAKTIRNDLFHLSVVLKNFKHIHWLVIESDSSDNTLDELVRLQGSLNNFRFISLGDLRTSIPKRTARIAHCRNKYLEELHTNPDYISIRYLVVADLDGINTYLTEEAFLSCWRRDDWAVCTANQRAPYYDLYALRHPYWCPEDVLKQQQFFERYVGYEDALRRSVKARMIVIPEAADWIEVDSAFGGMAIYKREAVEGASYSGLDAQGNEICEHIELHKAIRGRGLKLFINPAFINAGYTEHSTRYRLMPSLRRAAINYLKAVIRRRS